MYEYRAKVTKVYDGDTITVDIDLGFGIWVKNQTIRLAGINTPEVRGEERPEGLVARDQLRSLLMGREIILQTEKDKKGKYGRYLGTLFFDGVPKSVNDWLIEEGFADPY